MEVCPLSSPFMVWWGGSGEKENMQQYRGAVFTHDKAHKNERSDETMNGKV